MIRHDEYAGMSYEQASRAAQSLIHKAYRTGIWWHIVDRLAELRSIMQREAEQRASRT